MRSKLVELIVEASRVFSALCVLSLLFSYILYSLTGALNGAESLFVSAAISAGVVCWIYSKKKTSDSAILVCFLATLVLSTALAVLSFWLADIFDTFLISASFYVICLIGFGSSYFARALPQSLER